MGKELEETLRRLGTDLTEQNTLFEGKLQEGAEGLPRAVVPQDGDAEKKEESVTEEPVREDEADAPVVSEDVKDLDLHELTDDEIDEIVEVAARVVTRKVVTGKKKRQRKKAARKARRGGKKAAKRRAMKRARKKAGYRAYEKKAREAVKKKTKGGKKKLGKRKSVIVKFRGHGGRTGQRSDVDEPSLKDRLVERFSQEQEEERKQDETMDLSDLMILEKGAMCCYFSAEHLAFCDEDEDAETAFKVAEQIMAEVVTCENEKRVPDEEDFAQMVESVAIVIDEVEEKTWLPFVEQRGSEETQAQD